MSIIIPRTQIIEEFKNRGFRIVYHRELNNTKINLEGFLEKTDKLQSQTSRKLITTLEGDIVYKNGIYLTHTLLANIYPEPLFDFVFYKEENKGKAAHFDDVMDYLSKNYNPNMGPLDLDVELKDNLNPGVIEYVYTNLKQLQKEKGISSYLPSFFADNLDTLYDIDNNVILARHVIKSLDNLGYNFPILGMDAPLHEPDFNIVNYKHAKGNVSQIMYTPMLTPKQLVEFSKDEHILGGFTDIRLWDAKKAA